MNLTSDELSARDCRRLWRPLHSRLWPWSCSGCIQMTNNVAAWTVKASCMHVTRSIYRRRRRTRSKRTGIRLGHIMRPVGRKTVNVCGCLDWILFLCSSLQIRDWLTWLKPLSLQMWSVGHHATNYCHFTGSCAVASSHSSDRVLQFLIRRCFCNRQFFRGRVVGQTPNLKDQ